MSAADLTGRLDPERVGSDSRVRVIDRAVDILHALADGPRSLTEICRRTSLSKGTAFRLLAGLDYRDLVLKDPLTNRYMLGPGVLRLVPGALAGVGTTIATLAGGALERLSQSTQETVALHIPLGIERVCVYEVPSPQSIRYTTSVGSRAALHVGAAGKALLAQLGEPERREVLSLLDGELRREGLDPVELQRALATIRRQGWATSVGERVAGASAISIPVQSPQTTLALSVLGPTGRLPKARLLELLPSMRETADTIAATLGGGDAVSADAVG